MAVCVLQGSYSLIFASPIFRARAVLREIPKLPWPDRFVEAPGLATRGVELRSLVGMVCSILGCSSSCSPAPSH